MQSTCASGRAAVLGPDDGAPGFEKPTRHRVGLVDVRVGFPGDGRVGGRIGRHGHQRGGSRARRSALVRRRRRDDRAARGRGRFGERRVRRHRPTMATASSRSTCVFAALTGAGIKATRQPRDVRSVFVRRRGGGGGADRAIEAVRDARRQTRPSRRRRAGRARSSRRKARSGAPSLDRRPARASPSRGETHRAGETAGDDPGRGKYAVRAAEAEAEAAKRAAGEYEELYSFEVEEVNGYATVNRRAAVFDAGNDFYPYANFNDVSYALRAVRENVPASYVMNVGVVRGHHRRHLRDERLRICGNSNIGPQWIYTVFGIGQETRPSSERSRPALRPRSGTPRPSQGQHLRLVPRRGRMSSSTTTTPAASTSSASFDNHPRRHRQDRRGVARCPPCWSCASAKMDWNGQTPPSGWTNRAGIHPFGASFSYQTDDYDASPHVQRRLGPQQLDAAPPGPRPQLLELGPRYSARCPARRARSPRRGSPPP